MRNVAAFQGAPPNTLSSLPNEGGTDASIRSSNEDASMLTTGKAKNSIGANGDVMGVTEGKRTLNDTVLLLGVLLATIWALGGLVFRSANL